MDGQLMNWWSSHDPTAYNRCSTDSFIEVDLSNTEVILVLSTELIMKIGHH